MTLRFTRGGAGPDIDWLTERDVSVLVTLSVTRVASSDQLERLHFAGASQRAAQRCLARLSRQGLVLRMARRVGGVTPGSAPWAYTLAPSGQRLLGVVGPRGGKARRPAVPSPIFLRHLLLVTEVHVRAVEVSRSAPMRVERFAVEPDCWRHLPDGRTIKPDAELRMAADGYSDHYLIEADTGTEGRAAIGRKLALYRLLYQSGREQRDCGVFPQVLFVTLDVHRRAELVSQLSRQPQEVRAFVAVSHLSELSALLTWGPEQASGRKEAGR